MNGQESYYVEKRQNRSVGYMGHLASMVFEGLFERYPTLRVLFVEGGYIWLPAFLWHMDDDWKMLRSETPWVTRPPSEYIFEHCRFTTQPMEQPEPRSRLLTIFEWAKGGADAAVCLGLPALRLRLADAGASRRCRRSCNAAFTRRARASSSSSRSGRRLPRRS